MGKAIEWREQHIFRVAGDRLVEHWCVFDNLAILQQLGAVPMPG
jgi:predicted ester cyclase